MTRRDLTPDAVRQLTLDAEPWLSCDDCFRLLDEYVEQLVTGARPGAPEMEAHLAGCAACREEAESLLVLVASEQRVDPAPALRRLTGER